MEIKEAVHNDLLELLKLYTQLNNNAMPEINERLKSLWLEMMSDKNHSVIVGKKDKQIVSSCVLIIIPNLTHDGRPYALIENVITDEKYRGNGYATAVLNYAKKLAIKAGCYKIMLMTGSKIESTLKFYENAGYNRNDKTAFVQWL